MRAQILLLVAVVLLLRLPFLNQAIQGDDVYYLTGAQHALIDPAHPTNTRFAFQGEIVDMRGHPHPPLDIWTLAALLALFKNAPEPIFHAAYIAFSLIAALSMYFIARRFTDRPLIASLLFITTLPFVINGTSLESDLPFLAFWMSAIAFFLAGRLPMSILSMILASLAAFQAIVLIPILAAYLYRTKNRDLKTWLSLATPALTIAFWQIYVKATTGEIPATVLAGYFSSYGLQQLQNKLKSAAALTAHTGWIVFPALAAYMTRSVWPLGLATGIAAAFLDTNPLFWLSFAIGAMILAYAIRHRSFETDWILIFFAAALVIFFAGSARYLLPMAAPVCILASRQRLALPSIAAQTAVAFALAFTNYQHWDAYRRFASTLPEADSHRRILINGEWGLRHYLERRGAIPLLRNEPLRPGDTIVSSDLSFPMKLTGQLTELQVQSVNTTLPVRLIGLNTRSGYSTASLGFRPFDISADPIDRIRVHAVIEREPTESFLTMDAPAAQQQIVSGIYDLEGKWRWMGSKATLLFKAPSRPQSIELQFYIPDNAPSRVVTISVDGKLMARESFDPGSHTLKTPPVKAKTLSISVDKTFSVPGDNRELGMILVSAGYK